MNEQKYVIELNDREMMLIKQALITRGDFFYKVQCPTEAAEFYALEKHLNRFQLNQIRGQS